MHLVAERAQSAWRRTTSRALISSHVSRALIANSMMYLPASVSGVTK